MDASSVKDKVGFNTGREIRPTAPIARDANGNVPVQFVAGDRRRCSIRLGKINQRTANEIKLRVETLKTLIVTRLPTDVDRATWVAGIGDDLANILAAVELIQIVKQLFCKLHNLVAVSV